MESLRPEVMPGKLDIAASVKDQEAEKCHLASGGPRTSSVSKDTLQIVEQSEGDPDALSESVASEDGGCSMESDASSNALNGDSQVSDADSLNPHCEEKNLKRCPSGGSIVTYDEAASKLPEDGECERTRDRKPTRQPKGSELNGFDDGQETSINTGHRMSDSVGPAWTDDKHCSYLNSIEATFVQSLYGQDYCTVDVPGQDDQDCVESRPMFPNYGSCPPGCELFTSLQRGCYDQREYYRPQFLPTFAPTVFSSPWIQHFNPRSTPSHGGAAQEADIGLASTGFVEGSNGGTSMNGGVKEEVMESFRGPSEAAQGPPVWGNRFQSQHFTSTSAPVRSDTGPQAKKRSCNLDPSSDGIYRPKKHNKSTQQRSLAEMDLEMEEQFVMKEKSRKEQLDGLDLNEQPPQWDDETGGFDLNLEQDHEDETFAEELPQTILEAARVTELTTCKQPLKIESTLVGRAQEEKEKVTGEFELHECHSPVLQSAGATFGGESSGIKTGTVTPGHCATLVGIPENPRQVETDTICQLRVAFDEEEECELLPRKSPRASKTYTWGSLGTRRRLHNECNALVEAAVVSGSVKDTREDKL